MGLPFDTWKSWIHEETELDEGTGGQVDGWLNQLNAALDPLHRPFAYRVHKAVRTYVANYPLQDERGVRWAMADQIEQKILPKFRGLEPSQPQVQEALSQVNTILRELEDNVLLGAVQRAAGHTDQPFMFSGVDRLAEERDESQA